MSDKLGWSITGIVLIILLNIEYRLWIKFKKEKEEKKNIQNDEKSDDLKIKYIYALYGIGIIVLIIFISSSMYGLILIPFPKARGISRDTWVTFWGSIIGCTLGGIIGGIVAYKIMKYQIENENIKLEQDRKERIKKDLELNTLEIVLKLNNAILINLVDLQMTIRGILKNLKVVWRVKDAREEWFIKFKKLNQESSENLRKFKSVINSRSITMGSLLKEYNELYKLLFELNSYNTHFSNCVNNINVYCGVNKEYIENGKKKINQIIKTEINKYDYEILPKVNRAGYLIEYLGQQ
ncbi:MAG: hypothetical protein AAGU01_00515, partial [Clostridiaceae bacterium]